MGASRVQGTPLGGLGVRGAARRRRLDGAGGSAAEFDGGSGSPVKVGRGDEVGELHGGEADLVAGSIEGGGVRRRGFYVEQRRQSSATVAELEGEGVLVGIGRREVAC